MKMMRLSKLIDALAVVHDANINCVEIKRNRVGKWRCFINHHFDAIFVDGHDADLSNAIDQTLSYYLVEFSSRKRRVIEKKVLDIITLVNYTPLPKQRKREKIV